MNKRKSNVHVSGNRKDGYTVKSAGASRAAGHFSTKKDAEKRGREIAKNRGVELITHASDGKIQSKDSFGNDPCPPRDTEH